MSGYCVGYIFASLSTESINRRLANALVRLSPKHLKFGEIPIRDLPLYNRDFDTDYPPAGRALKAAMGAPEAYVQFTHGLITEAGEVADKGTEQFLRDFIEAFDVFVDRVLTVLPPERLGATG